MTDQALLPRMRRRPLLLLLIAACAGAWLSYDRDDSRLVRFKGTPVWRRVEAIDSVPRSTAEAEAAGARHPRASTPGAFPLYQSGALYFASSERRCVEVGDASAVRSGDIAMGSFSNYREFWAQPYGKLWAQTPHAPPTKVPLQFTLKAARLDSSDVAYIYKSSVLTYVRLDPLGGDKNLGWNGQIVLPMRGEWLLVASIHEAWGCFVFKL